MIIAKALPLSETPLSQDWERFYGLKSMGLEPTNDIRDQITLPSPRIGRGAGGEGLSYSTFENRLFNASATVGWANGASRIVVYGVPVIMAS